MLVRFFSMGSSCSPSVAMRARLGFSAGLLASAVAAAAAGAGWSRVAKMASQSCPSDAGAALPTDASAEPFWLASVVLPPRPTTLPPADESRLAKSKLFLMSNGADVLVRLDSDLVTWDGGDESNTGLKSSRPERLMVAKSSSPDPSLASSSPSKSSSRSSNGVLLVVLAVVGAGA